MSIAKTPRHSEVVMTELVLPNDTNYLGNLLGGRLMHWIDIAAALSAMRHSGKVCVTASVDEINFNEPIKLGHVVHIRAIMTRAFRTSMEVYVVVEREDPINGTFTQTSEAYLTFVSIDHYGKPLVAPPLAPETDAEHLRFEEAAIRRENRLKYRETLQARRG
jgi:acyl-CoA hydrolase